MKFHILCMLGFLTSGATAFATLPISRPPSTTQSISQLRAAPKDDQQIAEREYRELAAVFAEMNRSNIPSNTLDPALRSQIESYVRKVASERPTAIPLKDIGRVLPGTQWKLIFSTAAATMGDLPKDAQVQLEFDSAEDSGKVDYILEFSQKTFGLKRLVAKSSYTVDETNVNPGLVTFVYDDIVTDVFGFKNLGVGFFGMLKGRANYVETVFMDQRFWMERGYTPEGTEFVNVYLRQGLVEIEPPKGASDSQNPSAPTPITPIITSDDQWE